jgi:hypothetical protein
MNTPINTPSPRPRRTLAIGLRPRRDFIAES